TDTLEGMKENVICGHLIPAGTGLRSYERIVVGSVDDINRPATEQPQETKAAKNVDNILDIIPEEILVDAEDVEGLTLTDGEPEM
ncbi:MAG: hypothetical protein K2F99_02600, partial [Muribaculaceae bacterium]|nr:hypothetical protein [Muribaculaceae bacterium]